MLRFWGGWSALLQPWNKRAFEYTAITIGPFLFSTIEAEYFFYIKYEDDVGSNGDNGNNTVTTSCFILIVWSLSKEGRIYEKPILKFMDSDLNFSEMENKINKREGSLLLF